MAEPWVRKADLSALPLLRCLLITGVASKFPESEIRDAASLSQAAAGIAEGHVRAAFTRGAITILEPTIVFSVASAGAASMAAGKADAANVPDLAAFVAEYASGSASRAAKAAARDTWKQIRADARALLNDQRSLSRPLWQGHPARWFTTADAEMRAIWATNPEPWHFWLRWWEGVLTGQQIPWEVQRDIALIPDADWAKGEAHVAAMIAGIEAERESRTDDSGTPLANAALLDFDFDLALRRLEIVGFHDDMAHMKDPKTVQSFLDDIGEVEDGLQDFLDYAEAARTGSNALPILGVSTEKILVELKRTREKTHIRARRIIGLSGDLFIFSTEEEKRAELGEGLCRKLDANIALLRAVCRKHLAVAILQLAPLDTLALGNHDPTQLICDLKEALDRFRANADGTVLASFSPEALAVLDDIFNDLQTLEHALWDAVSGGQRQNLRDRFVKNYGALAVTLGKALEKANQFANDPIKKFDELVRHYKRLQTLREIWEWLNSVGGS